MELAQRIDFSVRHCKAGGTGILLHSETMETQSWREYMADGLEMIPGVKVDREILATLDMPPAKRKKAQAEIKERRAALAETTGEPK